MARVLVVGVARSGTTWVGRSLSAEPEVVYENEPDLMTDPLTAAILDRAWMPAIRVGDEAPLPRLMWAAFFNGGWPQGMVGASARRLAHRAPRSIARGVAEAAARAALRRPAPEHVVVKSVRTALCLEWLVANHSPTVVVVTAHPLNILSSWQRIGFAGWPTNQVPAFVGAMAERGLHPPRRDRETESAAFAVCGLQALVLEALARHPEWIAVTHESLCLSTQGLAEIARQAGLPWTSAASAFVDATNAPGSGYAVRRLTADQVDRWKRLTEPDLAIAVDVVERFAEAFPGFAGSLRAPEWSTIAPSHARSVS